MIPIDLKRIREALPNRAKVRLGKNKKGSCYIECVVAPSLHEQDTDQVFEWQREIIGTENISEFYTEETGGHWFVYLKRLPIEFVNIKDEDIDSYTSMRIVDKLKQRNNEK